MVLFSLGLTFEANASDIDNHWAKEVIQTWMNEGLINGYPDDSFRPDKAITRAEFMVLVNKAFEFEGEGSIKYTDVAQADWYYDIVVAAATAGYIQGYPDGSMKPNNPISRQEVTVILSKITNTPQNPSAIYRFTDANAMADWAKGFVGAAVVEGYMGGYPDGSFKPTNNITRAEAVVTLSKALTVEKIEEEKEVVYNQAGIYGPDTGIATIIEDVVIKTDGVTLQNIIIKGSLTIAQEVGDGDVYLNNVTVDGETFIQGGGEDSIHINGGEYNKITVQKTSSGNVRIVATNVDGLEVVISETAVGQAVILEGSFDSVTIEADNVHVVTQGETDIKEFTVKAGVKAALISLGNESTITKLVVDARTEVQGQGKIKEASGREVRNSTFEKAPERIILPLSGRRNSRAIKVSPAQVTASYFFDQTFTLAIENDTVTQAVYAQHITLDGVFTGLDLGHVERIDNSTVTAVVYGSLTSAGIGTITLDKNALVNSAISLKADVTVNELEMKVSPAQVTVDNTFDQIFTLTIENYTVTQAVYAKNITLGGVFTGLDLGNVDRIDNSTVTAAVYGSITSTGIGTITLDKNVLVNSTNSLEVGVIVDKGIVTEIDVIQYPIFREENGVPIIEDYIEARGLTPEGATVKYQWQHQIEGEGDWINIDGATEKIYKIGTPVSGGDYLRVVATGTGQYTGTVVSNSVTVGEAFSCPFVYSYEGNKYHFEHEAIPFAVNKALETTSYGTLRQLRAVDGKYHIRIVEVLEEKSFINGFQLIAVDYPVDEGIQEVIADIYGTPHTCYEAK